MRGRWLGRLLAVVVVLFGGLIAAPPPTAHACSCVSDSIPDKVARAEVVFGATVDRATDGGLDADGGALRDYKLRVSRVYKGDIREQTYVRSPSHQAACGAELPVSGQVLVFGHREGGVMTTMSCAGSGVSRPQDVTELVAVTSAGRAPLPGSDPKPAASRLPGLGQLGLSLWPVGAVVGASAVLMALLAVRRRRGSSGPAATKGAAGR